MNFSKILPDPCNSKNAFRTRIGEKFEPLRIRARVKSFFVLGENERLKAEFLYLILGMKFEPLRINAKVKMTFLHWEKTTAAAMIFLLLNLGIWQAPGSCFYPRRARTNEIGIVGYTKSFGSSPSMCYSCPNMIRSPM